jgi:DNA-binding XRE family transcriptional regulator
VAGRIGVTEETIYNWEMNRTVPQTRLIPDIIDFLGYVPYDPGWSVGQWLRAARSALGLSQELLARRVGLDESTVAKWERERHRPLKKKLETLKDFLRGLR